MVHLKEKIGFHQFFQNTTVGVYGFVRVDPVAAGTNVGIFGEWVGRIGTGLDAYLNDFVRFDSGSMCFPGGALVETPISISDIQVGETVLAYNKFGDLLLRRVKRLFRNITNEWLRLVWFERSEVGAPVEKELIPTPGHQFLDRFGNFTAIEEMIEDGEATVILANGEEARVKAERIVYSSQTAYEFEQAQSVASAF